MAFRILVADDSEASREALVLCLARSGFEVETAADGSDALQRLLRSDFDVSLLDVHMPMLTGLEVLGAMRQAGRDVPSILMTGHPSSALELAAMEAGALAMLRKPIPTEILRLTIRRIVLSHPGPPAGS